MITSHPPLFCCTCEWETSNSYTNDGLVVYVVIYVDSISYVQVNAVRLMLNINTYGAKKGEANQKQQLSDYSCD